MRLSLVIIFLRCSGLATRRVLSNVSGSPAPLPPLPRRPRQQECGYRRSQARAMHTNASRGHQHTTRQECTHDEGASTLQRRRAPHPPTSGISRRTGTDLWQYCHKYSHKHHHLRTPSAIQHQLPPLYHTEEPSAGSSELWPHCPGLRQKHASVVRAGVCLQPHDPAGQEAAIDLPCTASVQASISGGRLLPVPR